MHLNGSRAHQEPPAPTPLLLIWKCVRCGLDFGSREELRLHVLTSERHFICAECVGDGEWLDFLTERALRSHAWGRHREDDAAGVGFSRGNAADGSGGESTCRTKEGNGKGKAEEDAKRDAASAARRDTPLDRFFASFGGFAYDSRLSPEASFRQLEQHQGWQDRRDGPAKDAWKRYQRALVDEVEMWFGDENDLTAWRTLCRAVGRFDPPGEIRKCKAILRNTHVNIVDLIAWGRKGGGESDGEASSSLIQVFRSVEQLREYTLSSGKVFAKDQLNEYKGGNVVLRHLLRHLRKGGRGRGSF
ncbi:hypothetical protein Trco_007991 [Trichoderma cornu-damae]|uniref:C2H2-type domain-containing protein n=1 Tax=Trichoderma cornu-damae TaxID=654480 RepID=A0A9P8TRA2_9HYPO|nr:hypothetical protein Trco_007991 [Trichoderma cornu-damae]